MSDKPFEWLMKIEPKEYGLSIKVSFDLFDSCSRRRELIKYVARWSNAKLDHLCHQGFGEETMPGCLLCTSEYRWHHFWSEIGWNIDVCNGCGQLNYICAMSCELWEDDEDDY